MGKLLKNNIHPKISDGIKLKQGGCPKNDNELRIYKNEELYRNIMDLNKMADAIQKIRLIEQSINNSIYFIQSNLFSKHIFDRIKTRKIKISCLQT